MTADELESNLGTIAKSGSLNFKNENEDAKEKDIPDCSMEELWQSEPQFKYFSNPNKTDGKSTKNFDDRGEAYAHLSTKGVGVIKEIPGEPKRCGYCDAWDICEQRQRYFPDDAGSQPNRG